MNDTFTIRKLEYNDYYKDYMDLINSFTRSPESKTYDEFCMTLDKINSHNSHIFVIEHNRS